MSNRKPKDRSLSWRRFNVVRGFEVIKGIYRYIDGRGYVAGSYAAFMSSPLQVPIRPNDIDIFATSAENAWDITHDLCSVFGYQYIENPVVYNLSIENETVPIQVIKPSPKWKVFPDDIISSFDFDIICAALITPSEVIADINVGQMNARILRVDNPLRALKRVFKYKQRGVRFDDFELLKLFRAWEQYSPQMKGVDIEKARKSQLAGIVSSEPLTAAFWDHEDWFDGE